MTLPIIPTAGWSIAQGIGQGLGRYDEARIAAEERRRRNDLQNIALWQQLLPALSSYQAPQQHTTPMLPGMMTGGAIFTAPEQFKSPEAPGPIAQSLQRVTGQSGLGLTPETQQQFRTGAQQAKLAPLQVTAAEQNVALNKIQLEKGNYDLRSEPAREGTAYALTIAPSYVQAAISRGLKPTTANAKKIADAAYQAFVQTDQSPWREKISPELFAKAVGEEIEEAEKMGLQWYMARTSRDAVNAQNDPWKYAQMSADNYRQAEGSLSQERAALLSKLETLDKAMLGNAEYLKQHPEVVAAMQRVQQIDQSLPMLTERAQKWQNMLDAKFGGMAPLATPAGGGTAPAGAAGTPPAPGAAPAGFEAILDGMAAAGYQTGIKTRVLQRHREGLLPAEEVKRLAQKYKFSLGSGDLRQ